MPGSYLNPKPLFVFGAPGNKSERAGSGTLTHPNRDKNVTKWVAIKDLGAFSAGFYAEFRRESTIYITGPEAQLRHMAGKKLVLAEVRWVHAIFGGELSDFIVHGHHGKPRF